MKLKKSVKELSSVKVVNVDVFDIKNNQLAVEWAITSI